VAEIRQALDAGRFDQAFSAGGRLSQREAVAAVQGRSGTQPALRSAERYCLSGFSVSNRAQVQSDVDKTVSAKLGAASAEHSRRSLPCGPPSFGR
jgi:hypothetical protein